MNTAIPAIQSTGTLGSGDFTNYYNMLVDDETKRADLLEENVSKSSMEYIYRTLSLIDDFDEAEKDKRYNQLGKYFAWKGKKWATQKKK